MVLVIFQLTRPVWGEPRTRNEYCPQDQISTHSPRVGRTGGADGGKRHIVHFNSLAPCGANRAATATAIFWSKFQLTRPVWGEPRCAEASLRIAKFQLTRPVWGEP